MATIDTTYVSTIGSYENMKKERKPTNEMGKDQFLQILIQQMKSQDPMQPMQNDQLMSQMAQFSMIEQLQNMALSFAQSQTNGLIGRGIYAIIEVPDGAGYVEKREVTGIVDSVGTEYGKPYVMVGDTKVYTEDIKQVFDASILNGDTNQLLGGAAIIGKYVTAEYTENGVLKEMSGIVEGFSLKSGILTFKMDGREFMLSQITSMASKAPEPEAETGETDETDETGETGGVGGTNETDETVGAGGTDKTGETGETDGSGGTNEPGDSGDTAP